MADDAHLLEEEAVQATSLWLLQQWDACLQTLQKLEGALGGDGKVQHNLALAEFHATGSSNVDRLMEQLGSMEATAPAPAPEPRAASAAGEAAAAFNRALLLYLRRQFASALAVLEPWYPGVEGMPDGQCLRVCVLLAELYLASGQLAKLADVLRFVEQASGLVPPEPGMVGAARTSNAADDDAPAAAAAAAADAAADGAPIANGDGGRHSPAPPPPAQRRDGAPSSAPPSAPSPSPPPEGAAAADAPCLWLPSVTRVDSPLTQQARQLAAAQSAPPPARSPQPPPPSCGGEGAAADAATAPIDPGTTLPPVKLLLSLYWARLHLANHNHRAAKRDIKAALAAAPACTEALVLRAQLEASRQHPRKALRTLAPLLQAAATPKRLEVALLNNLAVLHHLFGKHQTASLYLSRALAAAAAVADGVAAAAVAGPNEPTDAAAAVAAGPAGWVLDRRPDLFYNAGLQQLMARSFGPALTCFRAAAPSYYRRPLLWLRMAEANIGLHHQQQRRAEAERRRAVGPAPSHPLLGDIVGEGPQRRLLLPEGHAASAAALEDDDDGGAAAAAATALLREALGHLGVAAAVLEDLRDAAAVDAARAAAESSAAAGDGAAAGAAAAAAAVAPNGAAGHPGESPSAAAAPPPGGWLPNAASEQQLESTQQAVFANQAYVALLLEDPVPALQAARSLLACSRLSQAQQFLGSCYAAEALCMLGQPQEAAEQLERYVQQYASDEGAVAPQLAGVAPAPRSSKSDEDAPGRESYELGNAADVARLTGATARAAVYANLASVAALRGDVAGCVACARQALAAQPGQREAALLLVWAELRQGGGGDGAAAALRRARVRPLATA